jgi:tRNA pseudouridine32 synthase/23S rRNA pseudouridine746 synthase
MSAIIDSFIAPPCHDDIQILWQDEHLLLIDKPSGLLSLSGKNPQNLDSVHYRLVQTFPGCTLVHRLDFGTSGLMVVARNKAINAALCQQFSQRSVEKVYSALLCGHVENDEGVIDAPIAKDPALFPLMSICAITGKPARSRYRVVERFYQGGMPLTRVKLIRRPGEPISCVFTASSWGTRFWAAICMAVLTRRGLKTRPADAACQRAEFYSSRERRAG